MSFSFQSFIVCIAALAAAPAAFAAPAAPSQALQPGEYQTPRGWGSLLIRAGQNGVLTFAIDTMGSNTHVCGLYGKIKGNTGYLDVEKAEPRCMISFKAVPNGVSVSTGTAEACGEYCGVNAWFEGDYLIPPSACGVEESAARRGSFTRMYQAKDYRHAYETLDAYYRQCGEFLNWIEIDKVRNDLAITQYYLGNKDACLAMLKDTLGAVQPNAQELKLHSADLEAYLPVAKATWYNLKLCGKGADKPPSR